MTIVVLSIGITHVWARGSLFARARALWPALLDCPLCIGVWISIAVQLGLVYATTFTVMMGLACISASLSLALYGLIRAIPVTKKFSPVVPIVRPRVEPRIKMVSNEDAAFTAREDGFGRGFW